MEKMKFETKLKTLKTNNSPLIKAAFQGKDGNVYFGIMLIDTGSFDCILNKSVMDLLDDSAVRKGDSKHISTIQGESNECYAVDFTFKMGNNQEFSDVFYVSEASDFDQILVGMIGIVGSKFLIRHQLTLDYAKEMLYTSDGTYTHPRQLRILFPHGVWVQELRYPCGGHFQRRKRIHNACRFGCGQDCHDKPHDR